jgi:hypothetical protein
LKKEKREQEIEKQWIDLEHQQMQDFDKKTVEKLEKDYKNKIANVKLVDEQIKEFRNKYVQQLQDEYLEGELIKKQTEENMEIERQKEIDRQIKDRQIMEAQFRANKELKEILIEQRKKEEKEDKEIAKFAKNKDRLDILRKEKIAELMKKVTFS